MLTGSSSENNQTCPVVFDELSHEMREITKIRVSGDKESNG